MKNLILLVLVTSNAFALTGDVSHNYQVDKQLDIANDRSPQSEKKEVPKTMEEKFDLVNQGRPAAKRMNAEELKRLKEMHKKYMKSH